MKTYTVVFREIRESEMQGIEAKSKKDAECMAEQIMQSWGQENWVSRDLRIIDCRLEREAKVWAQMPYKEEEANEQK